MEPISVTLGILLPILAGAKGVIGMIEKQTNWERQKEGTMSDLRVSMEALKTDAITYEVLLNAMTGPDADARPMMLLCKSQEGLDALYNLQVSLKAAKLLIEQNQVEHAEILELSDKQPHKRKPIRELIKAFFRSNILPSDETIESLKNTCKDLEVTRSVCQRSFKRVWNLYIVYQQKPSRRQTMESIGGGADINRALDDVLCAFQRRPFFISPEGENRVQFPRLTILNQNHEYAKRHEELMRSAGRDWVQDNIDRDGFLNSSGRVTSQVQALGQLQTSLFELLWSSTIEQMKRHGDPDILALESSDFQRELIELEKALQESILRAKKQRFAIAFCGMVKAGKSLFLNALIGESILPSDELPSTAWPCRLRHVPGQKIPELTFDDGPFISGLRALQKAQYSAKVKSYQPPSDDSYDFMLEPESRLGEEDSALKELHAQWADLHAVTRKNLDMFENSQFVLPNKATGHAEVKALLGILNDIIRLCFRFKLSFQMNDVEWPLLTVEFNSLRNLQIDGIYEFIDLPGIGERFETFSFESMVRLVAKDSNAIVPVISFKELARSDWKALPAIVANGFGGRASVVVCTHLDQIHGENKNEQLIAVSKVFWPANVQKAAYSSIIPCSSLMGLSARALLDISQTSKPQFLQFWDSNRKKVAHACAEKILGTGQPKENYDRMSEQLWRDKLDWEMKESGLPAAIKKLSREMVDQAKQRAFLMESEGIRRQLRKILSAQERKLLEARRSKREFDDAKREYEQARTKFVALIDSWNSTKFQLEQKYEHGLALGIKKLTEKAEGYISEAIKKTLSEWSLGTIKQEESDTIGKGPNSAAVKQKKGTTVLIVRSIAHAEEFLRLSQWELQTLLNREKQNFVTAVRKIAEEARAERFRQLKNEIARLDPRIQPVLREEIIEDLSNQSADIRRVVFNQIKNKIKTIKTRHTASSAFRAIEETLAKPLLSQQETNNEGLEDGEQQALQTIDSLGFMLRAPISVVATIPFVFGLPIWPWIICSKSIHLPVDVVESRYKEEIVTPWIRTLAAESRKTLAGVIAASSQVAKEAVENALDREDLRYQRENDQKQRHKHGMVQHMIALNSSLWAADSALQLIQEKLIESLKSSAL
ncbi:hypothetical protein FRC19_002548 [Serendipita sp. 401]|nr:hypothetical protein FRC19_002548 [Serendipita sp. 401]KAG9055566.1 hypothetical protein FS842_001840 [Serendipita sp. 407]